MGIGFGYVAHGTAAQVELRCGEEHLCGVEYHKQPHTGRAEQQSHTFDSYYAAKDVEGLHASEQPYSPYDLGGGIAGGIMP